MMLDKPHRTHESKLAPTSGHQKGYFHHSQILQQSTSSIASLSFTAFSVLPLTVESQIIAELLENEVCGKSGNHRNEKMHFNTILGSVQCHLLLKHPPES